MGNVEILAGTAVLLFFVMGAISTHIENRRRTNAATVHPASVPSVSATGTVAGGSLAGMDGSAPNEKELRTAIQRLSQVEKERDEARLAVSLTCELHGCASKSCTAAQYHEDAQVMIRRVETAEAKRDALQAKLDAILKLVEGELPELDAKFWRWRGTYGSRPPRTDDLLDESRKSRERQYLELKDAIREVGSGYRR